MAFQPLDEEPVQQAAQILLSFLSDASVSVPAPMVDGIVSGKTLLRGIINGQLVVCTQEAEPEKTVSKKVSKKQAA
jgi:hypothetical protein